MRRSPVIPFSMDKDSVMIEEGRKVHNAKLMTSNLDTSETTPSSKIKEW